MKFTFKYFVSRFSALWSTGGMWTRGPAVSSPRSRNMSDVAELRKTSKNTSVDINNQKKLLKYIFSALTTSMWGRQCLQAADTQYQVREVSTQMTKHFLLIQFYDVSDNPWCQVTGTGMAAPRLWPGGWSPGPPPWPGSASGSAWWTSWSPPSQSSKCTHQGSYCSSFYLMKSAHCFS